jgi:type I restriction enzyme S subunit
VAFNQDVKALVVDKTMLDPWYLLYWLMGQEQFLLDNLVEYTGIGAGKLDTKRMQSLELPLPPLLEQNKILGLIKALDDKVILLQETNATLEAIAQALFKSWFVDFDPVRAKAEGREPAGVPPEIAELFPSEFEDSELGEIPKGWSVSTFGDIADVSGGGTPSTKEDSFWTDGTHCWATPKDLSALDFPVLLNTERKITDLGLAKISSGLLPVGTLLMSSRAPIGYVAIAEVPTAINQGFIAIQPKQKMTNLFLLSLVRWRMDDIKNRANGSTFMEISKSAFRPIQVIKPAPEIVEQFDLIVRVFYNRLVCNMRQIESLASTRDSLLPRLMSGQLSTPS